MVLAIDEDRAHRQLRRLERAERPLDVRQALVGLDRLGSPQGGALQARPDDVYAVQLRLRVDLVLLPRPADLVVGHLDGEVLIHFFAADVAPHPPVEQVLALAGALVSQTGVEADQQALPGKSGLRISAIPSASNSPGRSGALRVRSAAGPSSLAPRPCSDPPCCRRTHLRPRDSRRPRRAGRRRSAACPACLRGCGRSRPVENSAPPDSWMRHRRAAGWRTAGTGRERWRAWSRVGVRGRLWREWTGEASWRSAGDGELSSPALSRTGAVIRLSPWIRNSEFRFTEKDPDDKHRPRGSVSCGLDLPRASCAGDPQVPAAPSGSLRPPASSGV